MMEMVVPTPQVSFLYSSGHLAGGKHGKLAIHSSSQLPDAMQYMDEASSYTADLARGLWGGGVVIHKENTRRPCLGKTTHQCGASTWELICH